ncbi:MAG: type 1 glutamine amidotransferase [Pseudomonadota bacterium]|nr:type 1 glutamine amidotransferase [Pseudomonadota bacterium]
MRIGILETGYPPQHLVAEHGTYPDMFRRFLGDGYAYQAFDVQTGAPPADPDAFDAVAVLGSPSGVYDGDPWIGRLLEWLRQACGRTKLVGSCFGHQAMAQAFGGEVRKSDKGWGLGLHRYEVLAAEPWMDAVKTIAAPVSHQDQVVVRPPEARVLAGNAFTPHAILTYADRSAISFQCHPEFTVAYAQALVERRRGQVDDAALDGAKASLEAPNDDDRIAGWVRAFISA